ncbi:MAG: bifunctional UDP-sugar hydrolase/5'-nucleotidase [Candidatus Eisenbacteria bacterium]
MRHVMILALCLTAALASVGFGAEPIHITIMHTNDVHGGIDRQGATFMDEEFPPQLGGGASLATLVKTQRAKAEKEGNGFLLFDTGDIWQGSPVGNYKGGEVVIEFMNRLGYDAWAPGNHEFDAGLENAFKLIEMAEFPVVAANLLDRQTGSLPPPATPYIIKEVAGVRIGIIGLITEETEYYSLPETVSRVEFLEVKPVTEKYIAELKGRVDLIFVISHLGIPYDVRSAYKEMIETGVEQRIRYGMNAMELVHHVPGIDLLVGGHIHVGLEQGWEDPLTHTICLQTYGRGTGVGVYEILVDPGSKKIVGYNLAESGGSIVSLFEDEYWPDAEVAEFIEEWVDTAEVGMDEPIGRALIDITRVGVGESQLGNMITDAMREAVDADVAFTNLGGIRSNLAMGVITPRDVFRAVPFENTLVYFEMTGSYLKHVLEWRVKGMRQGAYVSGIEAAYSRARPDFDRLVALAVGGEPWDPDRIYRVATTDFIAAGNIGLQILTEIDPEYVHRTDIQVKEAVIDYVRRHSPLAPRIEGRLVRDDDRAVTPELTDALPRFIPLENLTH